VLISEIVEAEMNEANFRRPTANARTSVRGKSLSASVDFLLLATQVKIGTNGGRQNIGGKK
jgi:hypothetical protein